MLVFIWLFIRKMYFIIQNIATLLRLSWGWYREFSHTPITNNSNENILSKPNNLNENILSNLFWPNRRYHVTINNTEAQYVHEYKTNYCCQVTNIITLYCKIQFGLALVCIGRICKGSLCVFHNFFWTLFNHAQKDQLSCCPGIALWGGLIIW